MNLAVAVVTTVAAIVVAVAITIIATDSCCYCDRCYSGGHSCSSSNMQLPPLPLLSPLLLVEEKKKKRGQKWSLWRKNLYTFKFYRVPRELIRVSYKKDGPFKIIPNVSNKSNSQVFSNVGPMLVSWGEKFPPLDVDKMNYCWRVDNELGDFL